MGTIIGGVRISSPAQKVNSPNAYPQMSFAADSVAILTNYQPISENWLDESLLSV
jgi:hypothetical protein